MILGKMLPTGLLVPPMLLATSISTNGVLKSIDGGKTWNNKGPSELVWDIDISNTGQFGLVIGSSGVYKSNDFGETWNHISSIPGTPKQLTVSGNGDFMTVLNTAGVLSCSSNFGEDWYELTGIPPMNSVFINKNNIYDSAGISTTNVFLIDSFLNNNKDIPRDSKIFPFCVLNGHLLGFFSQGIYTLNHPYWEGYENIWWESGYFTSLVDVKYSSVGDALVRASGMNYIGMSYSKKISVSMNCLNISASGKNIVAITHNKVMHYNWNFGDTGSWLSSSISPSLRSIAVTDL